MTWFRDLFRPLFADEIAAAEQEAISLQQQLAAKQQANPQVIETVVYREAREFASYEELRLWLRDNSISEREYHFPDQDCDDFARQTQAAALKDGYLVNVEYDPSGYYHKDGKSHMVCTAVIDDHLFIFDPQTDTMLMDGPLD